MPTTAAIDEARLAALAEALGPARLMALIAVLRERLEGFGAALAADAPMTRGAATQALHQLRGAAGSLGLTGLEAALTRLEQQPLALGTLELPPALADAARLIVLHAEAMTEVTRLLPTAASDHGVASKR